MERILYKEDGGRGMTVYLKQNDIPQSCTGRYAGCIFALENPHNLADECLISEEELDVTCCDDERHPQCPLKVVPNERLQIK